MTNIPRKFRKETTVSRLDGVYIGIIRVVADPQRFGRLQVWIPDLDQTKMIAMLQFRMLLRLQELAICR